MKADREMEAIVIQLRQLHLQQAVLLERLERLPGNLAEDDGDGRTDTQEFEVGNQVKIKNPGPFQAAKGTIVKIGKDRITVLARNGTKIVRAPRNLTTIKLEH